MFIISNFLVAVAEVLGIAISVLWWLIIIRALISWVNPDPFNPIVQFLTRVTEPFLIPFRRIVPAWKIGIDIAPIFAIMALLFLRYFLVSSLIDLARLIK
ncbi:MAG: YggT family protein [Candidatus Omnitrophica bacterium]|nr:YggT family protein [Candidatus Omnitrophota bacterium]